MTNAKKPVYKKHYTQMNYGEYTHIAEIFIVRQTTQVKHQFDTKKSI